MNANPSNMLLKEIILYDNGRAVFDCETFTVEGIWGAYSDFEGNTFYNFIFQEYNALMEALAQQMKAMDDTAFEGLINNVSVQ